jgi:hypothetical protein
MHDHSTRVALVRNMDCQRRPPPPPPTTHAQHRSLAEALETAPAIQKCTPNTRILHRARMTQPRFFTFSQAQRAPPRTCQPAPRSPTPLHHAHARTCAQTTRQAQPSTTARQRHGACHPKQRTPTSHAPHIAHSHAAYSTQAPHARTTPRTAPTTVHCPNITACTPPRARHTQHGTQLRPPHTPPTENHTQSHTRPPRHTHSRDVRLPSVDGMLPESWLSFKLNALQDTRTAIASHHGTRRR